jgi:hypothetical protein
VNSMPNDGSKQQLRLDSWKSIARHFGRTPRTVQRWHSEYGLPVRHLGGHKSSIFAYADELDSWMRNRGNSQISRADESARPELVRAPIGPIHPGHTLDSSLSPERAQARSRELVDRANRMWESLSHENLHAIVQFLREACDQDPTNASAFGCLSLALIAEGLWGGLRPEVAYLSARATVRRALEIDSEQIEAKSADAWLKTVSSRD